LQTITLGIPFWAGRRLLSSACDPVAAVLGTEPLVLVDWTLDPACAAVIFAARPVAHHVSGTVQAI
jgi:cytochrome c oxidase assembly factor CtaG